MRRDFSVCDEDVEFLEAHGWTWELIVENGSRWLLIHCYPLPDGYTENSVRLAIKIEAGYPDAALDMCYFFPFVKKRNGSAIACADVLQPLDGQSFQRWSRHRTSQNPWRPGVDSIGTHVLEVGEWLTKEVTR